MNSIISRFIKLGKRGTYRGKGKGGDIAGIQNGGIRYLPESVYDV